MDNITNHLLGWYKENKRDLPWRETKNPYYIWISEIMLQQTRVEAVKTYYQRFIETLPTLKDLASVEEDKLLKLWEGLGYYSRVRNMQKTAKILVEEGKDNLPNNEKELLQLPGIGNYTVGAILSIAFDKPSIAIDGNAYRVLGRYYKISESISKPSTYKLYASYFEKIMPSKNAGDFTQSFMDLGSSICTPKHPKCEICPLQNECIAHKEQKEEQYPVKNKKKEQRIEERNVYLFVHNNRVAIQKRKDSGLLASLYEFPNQEETINEIEIENKLRNKNISFRYVKPIGESKHVFSHIIWYMKGYLIELNVPIENMTWVTGEELKEKYSLPTAFSYFAEQFLNNNDSKIENILL